MDAALFRDQLASCVPADAVHPDAPLAPFTTFNVGGPADWLVDVSSVHQLSRLVALARQAEIPITVLGGGSNVVIADEGLRGIVARLRLNSITQLTSGIVRAEAGATINGLVRWTVGRSLAGLEAWAGTPGSVGGAIYGNAHYDGRNIGDHLVQALVCTWEGRLTVVPQRDMAFAYDTSRLQLTGEILIWADFRVGQGETEALRAVARQSLAHRKRTQPLAQPSAGCLFQNPDPARDEIPPDVPASAGALIDRAGLKGHRVGGAMISPVHANFVVSDGKATARDIWRLAQEARDRVRDRFGVELRNEVVFLGNF